VKIWRFHSSLMLHTFLYLFFHVSSLYLILFIQLLLFTQPMSNRAVLSWVQSVIGQCASPDSSSDAVSLYKKVFEKTTTVNIPVVNDFETVVKGLQQLTSTNPFNLVETETEAVAQRLELGGGELTAAVYEVLLLYCTKVPNKEEFIRLILTMDEAEQGELAEIIQSFSAEEPSVSHSYKDSDGGEVVNHWQERAEIAELRVNEHKKELLLEEERYVLSSVYSSV
jgi:hypothetical protein